MIKETHIVYVSFRDKETFERLKNITGNYSNVKLHHIDTAINAQFNIAFEFSGYQHGMQKVLREDNSKNLRIIFINSTFFDAHIKILSNKILHHLLTEDLPINSCTGIKNYKNTLSQEVDYYFTTWIFMLYCKREFFQNFQFHGTQTCTEFNEKTYYQLPKKFIQETEEWLQPRWIHKGWYQATPFKKTKENHLIRKRYAIYLEHKLPELTTAHEVSPIDIKNKKIIYFFVLLDRFINISKKIIHRTSLKN